MAIPVFNSQPQPQPLARRRFVLLLQVLGCLAVAAATVYVTYMLPALADSIQNGVTVAVPLLASLRPTRVVVVVQGDDVAGVGPV